MNMTGSQLESGNSDKGSEEKLLIDLLQMLQKLIGFHRQLIEHLRIERDGLVEMNLSAIDETRFKKEAISHQIKMLEDRRILLTKAIGSRIGITDRNTLLSEIITHYQTTFSEITKSLLSTQNTLKVMHDRVVQQNEHNQVLLEKGLVHINAIKKNILGELTVDNQTYSAQAKKNHSNLEGRLLSKEI